MLGLDGTAKISLLDEQGLIERGRKRVGHRDQMRCRIKPGMQLNVKVRTVATTFDELAGRQGTQSAQLAKACQLVRLETTEVSLLEPLLNVWEQF